MLRSDFNGSYDQYLILRGYDPRSNKLVILKRALVDSWGEPGFYKFWRVWNPGIGYLLYRLYLLLGGNRIWIISTMLVFTICGAIHDAIVMLLFRRPFVVFTTSFILFGILTVISRSLALVLQQERWPKLINIIINLSCVVLSIHLAVKFQMALFP